MRYDRLLIRPRVLDLVEALTAAQAAANSHWSILEQTTSDWQREVVAFRDQRVGHWFCQRRIADRSAMVGAVWWTDRIGQRHFRVLGVAEVDRGRTSPFPYPEGPILRNLYPEVCMLRGLRGSAATWCLRCDCGEIMPINTTDGWMGRHCIVCHDRTEGGETLPRHGRIAAIGCGSAGYQFTDGRALVLQQSRLNPYTLLRLLDPSSQTPTNSAEMLIGLRPLDVSNDGCWIVGICDGNFVVQKLESEAVSLQHPARDIHAAIFSPDSKELATFASESVVRWSLNRDDEWELCSEYHQANGFAWCPATGQVAVISQNQVKMVRENGTEMLTEQPAIEPPFERAGAREFDSFHLFHHPPRARCWFLEDGSHFYCLLTNGEYRLRQSEIVTVAHWTWTGQQWSRLSNLNILSHQPPVFSPNGRYIAYYLSDQNLLVVMDLQSEQVVGTLGWDTPCRLHRFTADGTGLIVGIREQIQIVPWAVLLPH